MTKEKEESVSNRCTQGFDENTCPFRDTCEHITNAIDKTERKSRIRFISTELTIILCFVIAYLAYHFLE